MNNEITTNMSSQILNSALQNTREQLKESQEFNEALVYLKSLFEVSKVATNGALNALNYMADVENKASNSMRSFGS